MNSPTPPFPLAGSVILVTGGAGLIGSHITDQALEKGVSEVRVLDNLVRGNMRNLDAAMGTGKVRFIPGDIRDPVAVRRAAAGCDYVFHQAALRITLCAEKPRDCMEVLVAGTFNVIEACVEEKVRKLVAASSASIYGAADAFPTPESHHPYHNRTLYGGAKVANEQFLRAFHEMYGLPYVALRYFNVYGPRMDMTGAYTEVFIRWMQCIHEARRPQIFGDGLQTMDFVNARDIARANLLAMEAACRDDVFNIASGTETSLLDLWAAMKQVAGNPPFEPEFLPARKVNPVPRRLADVHAAEKALGFRARITLKEGLHELWEDFCRLHPSR